MAVIILAVVVIFLGVFACSQPHPQKPFSPFRVKFNKACLYALAGICVFSVAYMLFGSFFSGRCPDFDIETQVYAIEMKTDGHRLLAFMPKTSSVTLFGDEASELMESAFGKMNKGKLLDWNSAPAWQGKYTCKVYYTEHDYELAKAGKSPDKVQRNDPTQGCIYRFTICESGSVYCYLTNTDKPTFRGSISWSLRSQLFPIFG